MATQLDAVTIIVMLMLVDIVSLTSVLFKEYLHTAIWSTTLSFLLLIIIVLVLCIQYF